MLRSCLLTFIFVAASLVVQAQLLQRIRGKVVDKEAQFPLTGVQVLPMNHTNPDTVTDSNGFFLLENIPLGKQTLQFLYTGYQPVLLRDVLVTSGKEVILPVEMEETADRRMNEVTIKTKRATINEMALVSTRMFDVQETERYAGSRADPARMASNFAGVQGSDDSRNDIIVRGNTPQGILYRLEDIDIPNPNHFAGAGNTGGPVTMLNTKTLGNSDFLMSAFPAGYGNATSGIFDLKMRNGNNRQYEATAQLGLLGTELAVEGPLSRKSGSSFLATYRYSTLKLFEGLNIKIGTNSIPAYQDAAFKLNFPLSKKTNLSFWGIGGLSRINLVVSNLNSPPDELYGQSDRDQYYHSNTGVIGSSFSHTFNMRTYTKVTVAYTVSDIGANHDKVFRNAGYQVDSLKPILGFSFLTQSLVSHWFVNHKLSSRHTFRAGIINNLYLLQLTDSSRQYPVTQQQWQRREDYKGNTNLLQAYVQYKYRPSDQLTITAGLHAQYLSHNGSKSLEPRAALRYTPGKGNKGIFTLGYGLHSMMQPLYQYFTQLPQATAGYLHNYNIGFSRSHHLAGGYERMLGGLFRLRSEVFYQYLFRIPIERRNGSAYSGINQGATFDRLFPDTLWNGGTGYNYGIELTIEKNFSRGYYFLFSGSLFESKAKGNDDVFRNTDYNGHFAFNLLGGYEKKIGKNSTLFTGAKITWAGGRRYSPPDVAASNTRGDLVLVDSQLNTLRFPDYFRSDLKLGIRVNTRQLTHEIALDLVNILGTRNILSLTYSPDLAAQGNAYPFYRQYQLGFLPLFYYKVDWAFRKRL
jgi:hypothetical protein